jgi:hypothetical protein
MNQRPTTQLSASAFEDELLELIDNRDEFTRSDLQGIVGALVRKIIDATIEEATKIDAEELRSALLKLQSYGLVIFVADKSLAKPFPSTGETEHAFEPLPKGRRLLRALRL